MLASAQDAFGIAPDYDLGVMAPNQTLSSLTASLCDEFDRLLVDTRPDLVVVQGDTTTAFCGSLCSYYRRIPVAHVEAGLRSHDLDNPFPEEANRRLIAVIGSLHFAPTPLGAANLLAEGVSPATVVVTGNTVVDALLDLRGSSLAAKGGHRDPGGRRTILVTAHRREAWGEDLAAMCRALLTLRDRFTDIEVAFPVHLNPNVRETVQTILGGQPRIRLLEPMNYFDFLGLMEKAFLILTDSGGIQEEAPTFRIPVLVMRRLTERPEAVQRGLAKVVGMDEEQIVREASRLLDNPDAYRAMTSLRNPFGDGQASARIVRAIGRYLDGEQVLLSPAEQFTA